MDWKTVRNCTLGGTCDNREQYLKFEETLKKIEDEDALYLFNSIEMPLVEVLTDMELTGVKVNPEVLDQMNIEFKEMTNF